MWGGVKRRQHHGDVFRNWSASRGVHELRARLWREPRPWYIAYALHQHKHLLHDTHAARLLSWCTSVVQLRLAPAAKTEAYRYAQETFQMLVHNHKVGHETMSEYMRLCAVGKDLTSAYAWHRYWLESNRLLHGNSGSSSGNNSNNKTRAPWLTLLLHYTWLLRIAHVSPDDERANDMAVAVMDGYCALCRDDDNDSDSDNNKSNNNMSDNSDAVPLLHPQATTLQEAAQLRAFRAAFALLLPRVREARVRAFVLQQLLPSPPAMTRDEAVQYVQQHGWPGSTRHHLFAQLEQGVAMPGDVTLHTPYLRDSLLHTRFVAELTRASFAHDVPRVVALLQLFDAHVRREKKQQQEHREDGDDDTQASPSRSSDDKNDKNDDDNDDTDATTLPANVCVWCNDGHSSNSSDDACRAFRAGVVARGGLTAELYHYLVVALAHAQPTAALRTLQRMADAHVHALDLTRTVVIAALSAAPHEQQRLFGEQLDVIEARARYTPSPHDEQQHQQQQTEDGSNDSDTSSSFARVSSEVAVEAYWRHQYTRLLHERNALSAQRFYELLLEGMSVARVQELLRTTSPLYAGRVTANTSNGSDGVAADELVVLDDALRNAVATHYRRRVGVTAVQRALDDIATHTPRLDVALVGAVPHFDRYVLTSRNNDSNNNDDDDDDVIATDVTLLQRVVSPYDVVYVLDASFVETSEAFLQLGRRHNNGNDGNDDDSDACASEERARSLVLLPYVMLSQLATSVSMAATWTTMDTALRESARGEPLLASQRLRALYAMWASSSSNSSSNDSSSSSSERATAPPRRVTRVLHYSECLLAHAVPEAQLQQLQLQPDRNDDDHLLLVVALVRALTPPTTRVVLCSDDEALVQRVRNLSPTTTTTTTTTTTATPSVVLFAHAVEVLSTAAPAHVDVTTALIDDNPRFDEATRQQLQSGSFVPRLSYTHVSRTRREGSGDERNNARSDVQGDATDDGTAVAASSPWLDLLSTPDDDDDSSRQCTVAATTTQADAMTTTTTTNTTASSSANLVIDSDDNDDDEAERLMHVYADAHAIVPLGAQLREAAAATTGRSLFELFDVVDPDEAATRARDAAASQTPLTLPRRQQQRSLDAAGGSDSKSSSSPQQTPRRRRRSALEREAYAQRGLSHRERTRLAQQLSHTIGRRVPFHLRYRVVEANVNDRRHRALRDMYDDAVAQKRAAYLRHHQREHAAPHADE